MIRLLWTISYYVIAFVPYATSQETLVYNVVNIVILDFQRIKMPGLQITIVFNNRMFLLKIDSLL